MGNFEDTWNRQLDDIKSRLSSKLSGYSDYFAAYPDLKLIATKVIESAATAELNEGYGGGRGDGGASNSVNRLMAYLDGFRFRAGGRDVAGCYQSIIDEANREKDKDYQLYLELKKKFG